MYRAKRSSNLFTRFWISVDVSNFSSPCVAKSTYEIATVQAKKRFHITIFWHVVARAKDLAVAQGYFPRLPWGILGANNDNFWFTELHRREMRCSGN
jgi:hypothetical protein